jgi:hypothetical protein
MFLLKVYCRLYGLALVIEPAIAAAFADRLDDFALFTEPRYVVLLSGDIEHFGNAVVAEISQ